MKHAVIATAALCAASQLNAGGIERSRTPIDVLFEAGNYAELSFSYVSPSLSGSYPAALGGGSTASMSESYTTLTFAYKHQFSDRFAAMVTLGQPYGADANYSAGAYTGLQATWDSTALTALGKYQASDRVSVYGGVRVVNSSAQIAIPAQLLGGVPYTAVGSNDTGVGWVAGAAYEIPDIALRVALTYESAIDHSFTTAESFSPVATTTDVEIPQSITLDFQTGIAADTLLFGSVKWAEWSTWEIAPPAYVGATGQRVTGFDDDRVTWQLGVGRRLNEQVAVFARAGYEAATGSTSSRLSPRDGFTSFGLGGTLTLENNAEITAGVEYVSLGDATDSSGTQFTGNDALAFGVSFGMSF